MNRRKQTRPKRTSCPEGAAQTMESSSMEMLSGTPHFPLSLERDGSSSPAPLPPPTMEDECDSRSSSICDDPHPMPVVVSSPTASPEMNIITQRRRTLDNQDSLHAPESPESTNNPNPQWPESNSCSHRSGFITTGGRIDIETVDSRKTNERSSSGGCVSPVSLSGSEKELDSSVNGPRSIISSVPISSFDHQNKTIVDGLGPEQSFVRQLESFVASMDRQTKLKPNNPVVDSQNKFFTNEFDGSSGTLKRIFKQDDCSKYLYNDQCSSPSMMDFGPVELPLDLSTGSKDTAADDKTRLKCNRDNSSMSSRFFELNFSPASGSLLASLEQKFGEHSQILDRVGSLPRSSQFAGTFPLGREANHYSSKLAEIGEQVIGCRTNFAYLTAGNSFSGDFRLDGGRLNQKERQEKDGRRPFFHPTMPGKDHSTAGRTGSTRTTPVKETEPVESADLKRSRSSTSLRCSCKMEFDRLYLLTVHLQETGHKPPSARPHKGDSHLDNTKLVRGQDIWLNSGSEQTRQILRCLECHRSFRSLPELTVHMIQTEHYMNLVQPELAPKRNWNDHGSSSSGSEGVDQFGCQFCSKVFEDADSLGQHIVTYGHYRQDQKPKTRVEATAGAARSSSSSSSLQGHLKTVSVPSKTDALTTSEKEAKRREESDIPSKIPRLDSGSHHDPTASSPTSSGEPHGGSNGFYRPLLGPSTLPPSSDNNNDGSDDAAQRQIPPTTDIIPEEEEDRDSALKAMQCFINRSFGQFQSPKPGLREGDGGDRQQQQQQQQNHPIQKSFASSWQPVRNFLTKLSVTDHSLTSRPDRKRYHNDCDSNPRMADTAVGDDPLRRMDGGQRRSDNRRPPQGAGDPVPVSADSFWKTNSKRLMPDHRRRPNEAGLFGLSVQPFGGRKIVTSPVSPPPAIMSPPSPMRSVNPGGISPHEKQHRPERNGALQSTLDSLQELVYSKPFKGLEHILQPPSSSVSPYRQATEKLSQSQALVISTQSPINKTIPDTLILVNPIVTVVPGAGPASSASLSVRLSPHHHHSPDSDVMKENLGAMMSSASPAEMDSVESDSEAAGCGGGGGEFKCVACKRNFASKGSYRYHRSRYHTYPDHLERSKTKDPSGNSCGAHLSSQPTNKFSKYYQLANELSSKSN